MDDEKSAESGQEATEFKPGESISPREEESSSRVPEPEQSQPLPNETPPSPRVTQRYTAETTVEREVLLAPESPWSTQALDADQAADAPEPPAITWTASEFIAHNKSAGWYVALAVIVLLAAFAVFFLLHDLITTIVIILAGAALGFYGGRQPRELQYALSPNGLLIANRYFPFDHFRSFAILDEGAVDSIVFMPLKRFGQILTIYFDPIDEERIVDLLADRLPMERKSHDLVDQFMRRIRF